MPATSDKVTTATLRARKGAAEKIAVVTAYDVVFARLADEAGIDVVLVGDSLGMVVQGERTTLAVTMDDMVYHSRIVSRGVRRAHLVADMPFMSYQASAEDGIRAAGRLLKEGRAEAVKLEGGTEIAELVRRLVGAGIPVMGHVGLTPQSVHEFGGFKVQGRTNEQRAQILADARAVSEAGAYAVVVEGVPQAVAADVDPLDLRRDDRYRRRRRLRRPGDGHARSARAGAGVEAAVRAALRRDGEVGRPRRSRPTPRTCAPASSPARGESLSTDSASCRPSRWSSARRPR